MLIEMDKKDCTGCGACYNICPKNAITMQVDEEGFKYPVIDKEKCINCKLCEKICPTLNKVDTKIENVIYDLHVENVTITVTDNSMGSLDVNINNLSIVFENKYNQSTE